MRTAQTVLNIIRERYKLSKYVTGERRDTEIGHASFGGGRLEKQVMLLAGRLPDNMNSNLNSANY
jgi:hypothetical protein